MHPKVWSRRRGRLSRRKTCASGSRRIAYVHLWRNANREQEQREHFYVAYPGHPSAADLRKFYQHPATVFLKDLPDMYH